MKITDDHCLASTYYFYDIFKYLFTKLKKEKEKKEIIFWQK